ncbi:hypothetical protein [Burkholderia sp. Ac-20365]|uniref:hypothetical protein n=1 Tax=Burkholderia sp. Ac-20365 TaxID=2703897 RepID=UPI00197C7776|nr:hypothetical protein [Burkholderia sp. Ac-20365]MBN3761273.1 hypothetical protein [Burkholderia sp. Ac-20365]
MKILGVEIRRPSYAEVTRNALQSVVLLVVFVLVCRLANIHISGYLTAICFFGYWWGTFSKILGIQIREGWRHLLLNVAGSFLIVFGIGLAHFALT